LRYTFGDRTGGFTGGMGSLPEALARKAKVITGMVALEVVREGKKATGVRAVPAAGGRARTYRADVVICALPATVLPGVAGKLGLPAQDFVAGVRYAPAIVVNFATKKTTVVFCGEEVPVLIEEPDGVIVQAASSACSSIFGTAFGKARQVRVDRHPEAFPVVSPGHAARVRTLFTSGSGVGNLLLAGDWMTSPTVEGAVSSGLAAAARALAQRAG
jgi:protoporphyrinogen oxidase